MIRKKIYDDKELNEINVTPFIDIMLVLLIIFMVVAPLITSSVPIDLPKISSKHIDEKKPIILSIGKEELALNEEKIYIEQLIENLNKKTQKDKTQLIYFHIDKDVNYEKIANIINTVKMDGYEKIALSMEISEQ